MGEVSGLVSGVFIDFSISPGVTIGSGLCAITDIATSGFSTSIYFTCTPELGNRVGPDVRLSIESETLTLPSSLAVGNLVRLYAYDYYPDEDGSEAHAYVLKHPDDGRLLLAYTENHFGIAAGTLATVGLTQADWYAPLSLTVTKGLCDALETLCTNRKRTRAALEVTMPGVDPARILDHGKGHVGDAYAVHVGSLERVFGGSSCVDASNKTTFLILALDPSCPTPPEEICNGLDDDGDGLVDENDPGAGAPCIWPAVGACSLGATACLAGMLVCQPPPVAYFPTDEVCNNIDDDCDGITDESPISAAPYPCETGQLGRCAVGRWKCGAMTTCVPLQGPMAEQCNGIDDDCDGVVDDACTPVAGSECLSHLPGRCALGTTAFENGSLTCIPQSPKAEFCNGIDDDCNGTVDDNQPVIACSTGDCGICDIGTLACALGEPECIYINAPTPEICDGIDNDCDCEVDNGIVCP